MQQTIYKIICQVSRMQHEQIFQTIYNTFCQISMETQSPFQQDTSTTYMKNNPTAHTQACSNIPFLIECVLELTSMLSQIVLLLPMTVLNSPLLIVVTRISLARLSSVFLRPPPLASQEFSRHHLSYASIFMVLQSAVQRSLG